MLEPVGPLPPSVYWRRRLVAATGSFLVLALLVWAVVGLAGAGEDVAPTASAARSATPDPAAPGSARSGAASSGAAGSPGDAGAGAGPAGAASPAGTPPSPAALAAGLPPLSGPPAGAAAGVLTPGMAGSALGPTVPGPGSANPIFPTEPGSIFPTEPGPSFPSAPGANTPAPAAPALPAAPAGAIGAPAPAAVPPVARAAAPAPKPCPDGAISVTARTDEPAYARGEKPVLSLVVTNTGKVACTRDLDAARQAVAVVRKPGDGLWGSNDCSPGHTRDVRTLAPGQEAVFAVRWSGRTSQPGCGGNRSEVPPGRYQLLARLDTMISDPVPFTLG